MQKPRKRSSYNANRPLNPTLTPVLFELLKSLPDLSFKTQYLKEQFSSKYLSPETAPAEVRRNRAVQKWLSCEVENAATNVRLMTISEDFNILPRVTYVKFMDTVRRFVNDVIGDVPPDPGLSGSFSGGSTTSRRRTESHPAQKYIGKADVTPLALDFALDAVGSSAVWSEFLSTDDIRTVEGNVLFTVPKTSEIDRCACKEPDLNMYLQKGLGDVIRRGLRKVGIDLNDQSRNRDLARQGSINGHLATIDLSSASDSVSTELVYQTVPIVWFTVLNALRSHRTFVDGDWHVNEMFSSMGNGFTFELESLLFYCVSRAVAYHLGVQGIISVYGDDIIVPVEMAESLCFVLSVLGFTVNTKKSFWTGPFRESCGGHYYNGEDVTPFYVKAPILTTIDLIHFLNSLRKWCDDGLLPVLHPLGEAIWLEYSKLVPKRLWGGTDYSDKSRLVSYQSGLSTDRLSPVTRSEDLGHGGYLLWLDLKENDSVDVISTSERLIDTKRYRYRPVRSYGGRALPFPAELEE